MSQTFRCSRGREDKPADAFFPKSGRTGKVQSWCRVCHTGYYRDQRAAYASPQSKVFRKGAA